MAGLAALRGLEVPAADAPVRTPRTRDRAAAHGGTTRTGRIRPAHFTREQLEWEPWIAVPEEGELTDEQRDSFASKSSANSVYFRMLSLTPSVTRARSLLDNAIFLPRDGLPKAERELAAAVTSKVNDCIYCASVHARKAAGFSKREEEVDALLAAPLERDEDWISADLAPLAGPGRRWSAIVDAAAELSRPPAPRGAAQLTALRDQGLDDHEITDLLTAALLRLGEPPDAQPRRPSPPTPPDHPERGTSHETARRRPPGAPARRRSRHPARPRTRRLRRGHRRGQADATEQLTIVDDQVRGVLPGPADRRRRQQLRTSSSAIGAGDRVIGVDRASLDRLPYLELSEEQVIAEGLDQLNYEAIAELAPDVVILPRNAVWQEALEQLSAFDIPVVIATAWDTEVVDETLTLLGQVFGVEDGAQSVLDLRARSRAARRSGWRRRSGADVFRDGRAVPDHLAPASTP